MDKEIYNYIFPCYTKFWTVLIIEIINLLSFYYINLYLFQRDLIRRLSLLGVNQISIDLSSGDILMR